MVVVVAQTQPLLLQMHNVTGSQHLLKMDVPGMVIDYALHEMMPTHWDTTFCWLQNQNFFQREHHHGKSLKDPPMSCALGMLCWLAWLGAAQMEERTEKAWLSGTCVLWSCGLFALIWVLDQDCGHSFLSVACDDFWHGSPSSYLNSLSNIVKGNIFRDLRGIMFCITWLFYMANSFQSPCCEASLARRGGVHGNLKQFALHVIHL